MSREHSFLKLIWRAALTAGAIYAVNDYIERHATDKKLLTYHSGNIYTWRDVKIYYTKQGEGSPLLLLHDLHSSASAYEWNRMVDLLAENHTVFTVDLPGMGRSDKRKQPYTNFYYVEFIKEFIKDMDLTEVTVVASNLSAAAALMTTVYDPTLIKQLILINPPSAGKMAVTPDSISKCKKAMLELPLIGTLIYNMLNAKTQIDLAFTETYLYNPFHENSELVDTCYEAAHLGHGQGRYFQAALLGNYLNIDISHALKKLSVPTLIIGGENMENSDQICKEWKNNNDLIKAVSIKHTRMLPHLEEPEEVNEQIKLFLS